MPQRQRLTDRGGKQTSTGGQVTTFSAPEFDRRFDNYSPHVGYAASGSKSAWNGLQVDYVRVYLEQP